MVEEENKDEKIRHENSSGCMHGNYVYQSVSQMGQAVKKKKAARHFAGMR